jgi:hypothetical protein
MYEEEDKGKKHKKPTPSEQAQGFTQDSAAYGEDQQQSSSETYESAPQSSGNKYAMVEPYDACQSYRSAVLDRVSAQLEAAKKLQIAKDDQFISARFEELYISISRLMVCKDYEASRDLQYVRATAFEIRTRIQHIQVEEKFEGLFEAIGDLYLTYSAEEESLLFALEVRNRLACAVRALESFQTELNASSFDFLDGRAFRRLVKITETLITHIRDRQYTESQEIVNLLETCASSRMVSRAIAAFVEKNSRVQLLGCELLCEYGRGQGLIRDLALQRMTLSLTEAAHHISQVSYLVEKLRAGSLDSWKKFHFRLELMEGTISRVLSSVQTHTPNTPSLAQITKLVETLRLNLQNMLAHSASLQSSAVGNFQLIENYRSWVFGVQKAVDELLCQEVEYLCHFREDLLLISSSQLLVSCFLTAVEVDWREAERTGRLHLHQHRRSTGSNIALLPDSAERFCGAHLELSPAIWSAAKPASEAFLQVYDADTSQLLESFPVAFATSDLKIAADEGTKLRFCVLIDRQVVATDVVQAAY